MPAPAEKGETMKLNRITAPLASLLLALVLAVGALAAEIYIHGFFLYTVEDQSVTIIAYTGDETEVIVPNMIGGNPVNTIAAGAFSENGSVKSVRLPDTVTVVEEGAFAPGQTAVFVEHNDAAPTQPETSEEPATQPDAPESPATQPETPESPATQPEVPAALPPGGEEQGSVWEGESSLTPSDPAPPAASGGRPAPAVPTPTPAPTPNPDPVVVVSNQRLTVDGEEKQIDHYNIDGYNYFKLRDLACILNGTKNCFDVSYDKTARRIELQTGERYTPLPTDLVIGEDRSSTAVVSNQSLTVNGKAVSLLAYNIGGSNYFMLRDLAPYLGFGVDYDEATRTAMILTHD